MLSAFMMWMQSVWSGASVILSELNTDRERGVELNFQEFRNDFLKEHLRKITSAAFHEMKNKILNFSFNLANSLFQLNII